MTGLALAHRRRSLLSAARLTPVLLVGPWLLQACSAWPTRSTAAGWTQGRLLLRVDATADQAAQSVTAAFELQGDGNSGELRLLTPLGTQLASALWSPRQVLLTTPAGEQTFVSLDALSQQAFGQSLPLAALPDWLAGRPWQGAASQTQPQGFEQLGWQVNTANREQGLVEARRPSAPALLLRVRLESPA